MIPALCVLSHALSVEERLGYLEKAVKESSFSGTDLKFSGELEFEYVDTEKNVLLKNEYYINREMTGGDEVDNDELLVQLEIKF